MIFLRTRLKNFINPKQTVHTKRNTTQKRYILKVTM